MVLTRRHIISGAVASMVGGADSGVCALGAQRTLSGPGDRNTRSKLCLVPSGSGSGGAISNWLPLGPKARFGSAMVATFHGAISRTTAS